MSNTSPTGGGGVYAAGTLSVEGGLFANNYSAGGVGGGLWAMGPAVISGTTFANNRANGQGGGAHLSGGSQVSHGRYVENSLFAGNTATLAGEHLFLNGSATVALRHVTAVGLGSGTAVHVAHSSVSINNTLIAQSHRRCQQP